jgi:cell division protein FtsN
MSAPAGDSGVDLILDNRKLIFGFAILMVLCGAFFVLGFVEGKRQAARSAPEAAPDAARPADATRPATASPAGTAGAATPNGPDDAAVREQLQWYRNVKPGSEALKHQPGALGAEKPAPPAAGVVAPSSPAPPPSRRTYSVQVGAFRQLKEAEARAATVKAKGYRCVIEPPREGDGLYLLKVGRYEARADAVAMRLRLKKDGFSTLIKSH